MLVTNSYFELQPKERLKLSNEEFQAYVAYECMREGIKIPTKPEGLREVPAEPEVQQEQCFKIVVNTYHDLVGFTDEAEARAFMAFKSVVRLDTDYSTGVSRLQLVPVETKSIQPTMAITNSELTRVRGQLKERAEIIKTNQELEEAFKKERMAYDELVERMNADFYELQRNLAHYIIIRNTFRQYLDMAKGNVEVATDFLLKVYSREDIDATYEWFKDDWGVAAPWKPEDTSSDCL